MVTIVPFIGRELVEWFWSGFTAQNLTLNRTYSIRFTMPFILAGVTIPHLSLFHRDGSNTTPWVVKVLIALLVLTLVLC